MKRLLLLVSIIGATVIARAQELNCKVTVNLESIPSAQRNYLNNFQSDVERYVNNTRFTTEDMNGEKIDCTFDIFFKSTSGDNRYQVQVFIGSVRPVYNGNDKTERTTPILRILDDKWTFTYTPNQRMTHDDYTFDPLTSFLDFYAYLILGYDFNTYVPSSGSPFFQKATTICQQSASSSVTGDWQISASSYSRSGIVDELTNAKFTDFLTWFNNYHFDGIDLLASDKQNALETILKAVQTISDTRRRQSPTSVVIKQFFDAKYKEIADVFSSYPKKDVYDQLMTYDPEHRATYEETKQK
jgi:hypothetical protein